jgi:ABC-type sugar transport system permease subunit
MKNNLANYLKPYAYIAPMIIFFILFMAYPIIYTAIISFFDWTGINQIPTENFIGLKNYISLFSDKIFLYAFRNTTIFVIATIIFQNLYGYFLALLLYFGKFKFDVLIRAIIFFPTLLAVVIVALVWRQILTIDGIVNFILNNLGIKSIVWLGDWRIALPAIIFVNIWQWGGYNMVIFYSGIQSVDPQLIEAATIDGASLRHVITNVITPTIKPVIIVAIILTALGGFKVFDIVYVLTRMGPANTTQVITTYVYKLAFSTHGRVEFSYSASVVMIFFIIVFIISLIRIRTMSNER